MRARVCELTSLLLHHQACTWCSGLTRPCAPAFPCLAVFLGAGALPDEVQGSNPPIMALHMQLAKIPHWATELQGRTPAVGPTPEVEQSVRQTASGHEYTLIMASSDTLSQDTVGGLKMAAPLCVSSQAPPGAQFGEAIFSCRLLGWCRIWASTLRGVTNRCDGKA